MATAVSAKKSYIDPKDLPGLERAMLARILRGLHPHRRQVELVVAAVLAGAGLHLLPPLFVKAIVDHLEAVVHHDIRGDVGLLALLCAGMVLGPLAAGLIGVGQKYLTALIGERVMLDLRVALFEHLNRQPLRYFVAARPGEAISGVLNDVQGIGSALSTTLVAVLENTLAFVSTAGLILYLDWRLALLALAVLPLFVFPARRVGLRRKRLRREAQARTAELTGILAETLSVSGAYLMRVFGAERLEAERLRAKGRELIELSLRQTLAGRWFQMLMGLFESVGPALVFGVGGYFVLQGRSHDIGTLVAFMTALRRLYAPASALAGVHVDLLTSYAYFERVFRLLDRVPEVRDLPGALRLRQVRGRIEFENVSFSFEGADETLKDVDLVIEPGQVVAFVGPSGAGKSTLVGLVPRLADPTGGRVLLDGHDLRTLELASLRSHVGVVAQEAYLFHGSVFDNLRYARPEADVQEVEIACRAAQIHETIAALPDGYATIVGDRGHRLSGGERQRVAIARALLKDPRILILDEATSSLDSVSESLVQSALELLLEGRTSLVIAHRLATVRRADLIVVLDRGRILERGTHDELLRRGGLYAQLHRQAETVLAV